MQLWSGLLNRSGSSSGQGPHAQGPAILLFTMSALQQPLPGVSWFDVLQKEAVVLKSPRSPRSGKKTLPLMTLMTLI
jgi:hypothetical protein